MAEAPDTSRAKREGQCTAWVAMAPSSPELPALLAALQGGSADAALLVQTLEQLVQLTAWQEENQRALASLCCAATLLQLAKKLLQVPNQSAQASKPGTLSPATPLKLPNKGEEAQAVQLALNVLLNVTTNDDLADGVAAGAPGWLSLLSELLSCSTKPLVVMAARCLINITHSCSYETQAAISKAGVLEPAVKLLMNTDDDFAACKLGAWLLSNLSAPLNSTLRASLLSQPKVLQRAVALIQASNTPGAVSVLVCQLLGNMARAGSEAQTYMAKGGAMTALGALMDAPRAPSEVCGAALQALSALVLDHAANTAALAAQSSLPAALSRLLDARTDPFTCTSEDSLAVLAAHTLIHVLGHMMCNGGNGLQPTFVAAGLAAKAMERPAGSPPGTPNSKDTEHLAPRADGRLAARQGPDLDLVDGRASLVVPTAGQSAVASSVSSPKADASQQVVYISLSAAARAIHVQLPAAVPFTGKHGEPALTPVEAAELRHRVTHVLLPRLRNPNPRTATTAAATLYHLVAACGGAAAREARGLITDAALVEQLLQLLESGHAALVHASLAVLDVLVPEPACARVLLAAGWQRPVLPALDSRDALVRRWAERVLCGLYMATNSGP